MKITVVCINCLMPKTFEVPAEGYLKWKKGMLIQRALPELTAEQREMLISNICPECWKLMFPPEEE